METRTIIKKLRRNKMKKLTLAIATLAIVGILAGCTSLQNKTFGAAGSVQAVKIETTGSTSTGTLLPNVILGGANSAIATMPEAQNRRVLSYSKSSSILGSLTSASSGGISFVYISAVGETVDETAKCVTSFMGLTGNSEDDEETDASDDETKATTASETTSTNSTAATTATTAAETTTTTSETSEAEK
jgi:hypothetical protein